MSTLHIWQRLTSAGILLVVSIPVCDFDSRLTTHGLDARRHFVKGLTARMLSPVVKLHPDTDVEWSDMTRSHPTVVNES